MSFTTLKDTINYNEMIKQNLLIKQLYEIKYGISLKKSDAEIEFMEWQVRDNQVKIYNKKQEELENKRRESLDNKKWIHQWHTIFVPNYNLKKKVILSKKEIQEKVDFID